jgi:signal peptidase I
MTPAMRSGDIVVVDPAPGHDYRPGQIASFVDPVRPDRVLLHRLVNVHDDGTWTTKGDANPTPDAAAVPADSLRGQARLRIPWIGLPASWAQAGRLDALALAGAGLATLVCLAFLPRRADHPRGRHRLNARPGRRGRARRRWPWLASIVVVGLVVAVVLTGPGVYAAFTGTTAAAGNSWGATGTFPGYPASVTADGPQFYHRADESQSASAVSTAADSSGNNRPGTYDTRTDGPSLWWKFDENTGTTAADASGAANPGTLTNGPAWSTGPDGVALAFDGADDHVPAARAAVQTTTSFTVSAWARLTTTGGNRVVISQAGVTSSPFYLQYATSSNKWRFAMTSADASNPSSAFVYSASTTALNEWTHLVAVHDATAGQIRLYVNGELDNTTAFTGAWDGTGALQVGRLRWNGGYADRFAGGIDDVRTWRRTLTANEITGLYDTPTTEWAFNEGTGSAVADSSGHANTGTLTGSWSSAGHGGAAGSFNGSSDYVTASASAVRTDRSFSVSAWAYLTSTGANYTAVSQAGTTSSAFYLKYNPLVSNWTFLLTTSDTSPGFSWADGTSAVSLNTWTHLAGVYDDAADQVRLYVNGKLESTGTATSTWNASGVLNVGRSLWNGTYGDYWAGRIDEVRTYNHALGTAAIRAGYLARATRWQFDEGSGSTVADLSGHGNTAALTGATWTSGRDATTAASFDGVDDRGTGAIPAARTDRSFSVAAWVYMTSTNGTYRTMVSQAGTQYSGYYLQYASDVNRWRFSMPATDSAAAGDSADSTAAPSTNVWTHLVGVYDEPADQLRLYVNGVLQSTTSRTANWNATGTTQLARALSNGAYSGYFPGRLDDVQVFDHALAAADAVAVYGAKPALRWEFEEGSGTTTADYSGSGNGGNLTGTPAWTTGGHTGKAITFDGVDDRVSTTTPPIRTNLSFTVSAWAYLGATGDYRTVVSQDGTSIGGFFLEYDFGVNRWAMSMYTSDSTGATLHQAMSTAAPTLNTWTHLVGVYDATAGTLRLYVNAVLQETAAHSGAWNATGNFAVGRSRWGGANGSFFSGRVDEPRVYQRPLAADEIADLHTATIRAVRATVPVLPAITAGLPGPLLDQPASTAVGYAGTSNAYNPIQYTNPSAFTVECWFRATGTGGGALIGFGSDTTGTASDNRDRVLYLDSAGHLTFGVHPGSAVTVRSASAYNDGSWHHAAASLGAAGLKIHVDGVRVDMNAGTTTAQNFAGYWRWGGIGLSGWPNRPANDYLVGTVDEIAVYPSQLSDQQIAWHYHANH